MPTGIDLGFVGCSVTGASHRANQTPCQDAWLAVRLAEDACVIAVADGHGSKSCPYSADGARLAVQTFCRDLAFLYRQDQHDLPALQTELRRNASFRLARQLRQNWMLAVEQCHQSADRPASDDLAALYGTTLLGVLMTPVFIFAFQLGDGDIVLCRRAAASLLLETPHLLGTETYSLSMPNVEKYVCSAVCPASAHSFVLLATDGFRNSFADDNGFFAECSGYAALLEQYGSYLFGKSMPSMLTETTEQGCGDDVTVAVAYPADRVRLCTPLALRQIRRSRLRQWLQQRRSRHACYKPS